LKAKLLKQDRNDIRTKKKQSRVANFKSQCHGTLRAHLAPTAAADAGGAASAEGSAEEGGDLNTSIGGY
jgi:hypothetical protein